MQTKSRTWLDGETASVTSRDEDEGTKQKAKLEVGRCKGRQNFEVGKRGAVKVDCLLYFPVSSDLIVLRRATLETRHAVTQDSQSVP
jgi:hypothetical protein